jgi:hypothetical protein
MSQQGEVEAVDVGGRRILVWPDGQEIRSLDGEGVVFKTNFADHGDYQPALLEALQARLADPAVRAQYSKALGGTKVYRLEDWAEPAARLINARAIELYKRAVKSPTGVIDMGWANVYQPGDYIVAHAHIRSQGSVVYMLDDGEPDSEDRHAGLFGIIDPRFAACCKLRAGYMTHPFCPVMEPGAMIVFPSSLVHSVNPHAGGRPRITMAWNLNREKLEGDTLAMLRQGEASEEGGEVGPG